MISLRTLPVNVMLPSTTDKSVRGLIKSRPVTGSGVGSLTVSLNSFSHDPLPFVRSTLYLPLFCDDSSYCDNINMKVQCTVYLLSKYT